MTVRPLVLLPDPILREVSKPIERFDADLKRFADDMLETMYEAPGIGLAAIQVGEPIRMLVADVSGKDEPNDPHIFVNPQIVQSGEALSTYEEGCLSIPDYYADVDRPESVTVQYQTVEGEKKEMLIDGMMATCLQHELDHLDGVLFIDHLSKLKRDMVIKRFRKLAKQRGGTRL
ncbi:MAG: peptide deformylase [Pseudomonadota bacterium]